VALTGAGDINADGHDDIVLGAEANGAYVFHGPITPGTELSDRDAYIGTGLDALAFAGDLDGDGFDDLLLGDTYYGDEPRSGYDDGAAYLYYGPISGELEVSDADAILEGSVFDKAGWDLDGGSDLDGDGSPDFMVAGTGFPNYEQNGIVYVLYGTPSGTSSLADADARLMGGSEDALAGYSAAMTGDVDGDGIGDVIVGAPTDSTGADLSGAVYVLYGPVNGDLVLSDSDAILLGEQSEGGGNGDQAGSSVATAGDHDGDGYDDLLIGAPRDSEGEYASGTTYLVHGPVTGLHVLCHAFPDRLVGEHYADGSGTAVTSPGDMDGDDRPDVVVGAGSESFGGSGAGAAYIIVRRIEGAVSLGSTDLKIAGRDVGEHLGYTLTPAGDADGDGRDDFIVGGAGLDGPNEHGGAAYLVPGSMF